MGGREDGREGGSNILISGVDIGSVLQQKLDEGEVVGHSSGMQSGGARVIDSIHIIATEETALDLLVGSLSGELNELDPLRDRDR
jgi:hypothetical protein